MSVCASMTPPDSTLEVETPESQLARGVIPPNTVLLNVYDIIGANTILAAVGMGVHHTGIEVYGTEYAFGRCRDGTGVFGIIPKTCPGHVFKETIVLGTTSMTASQVKDLITSLSQDSKWNGTSYHILRRNCNVFSEFLTAKLLNSARTLPGVYSPQRVRTNSGYTNAPSSPSKENPKPSKFGGVGPNQATNGRGEAPASAASNGRSEAVESSPEPLTPLWTNRIARFADTVLPNSLIDKIEKTDREAQGM